MRDRGSANAYRRRRGPTCRAGGRAALIFIERAKEPIAERDLERRQIRPQESRLFCTRRREQGGLAQRQYWEPGSLEGWFRNPKYRRRHDGLRRTGNLSLQNRV